MMFRRGKSSSKAKKGTAAPWQSGELKVDGGGPGSNIRQVAPDTGMGNTDDGTSRDETFFETTPWLESDCEDDFYSVNGDLTPARSFASRTSSRTTLPAPQPQNLPTLGAILKAEPLKPPAPQRGKLSDLLRETQDDDDIAVEGPDDLSKDDSLRIGEEVNRCCVPQFARAMSKNCNGRRQHKQ